MSGIVGRPVKVEVRFKIRTAQGWKYRTRTVKTAIITDQQGFIWFKQTFDGAMNVIVKNVLPTLPEKVLGYAPIWYRAVDF